MFNYSEGETAEESFPVSPNMCVTRFAYYSGNVCAELPECTVIEKVSYPLSDYTKLFNLVINSESYINTGVDSFGKSLTDYGANSTLGINKISGQKKIYWKTSELRPFNGNKYVSTQKLTAIGGNITSKTGKASAVIFAAQFTFGALQDYQDYQYDGRTDCYHMVRATVSFAGAWAGMEIGLYWGGSIGAAFGGVGAIPGSIIGATIGGFAGALCGGEIGGLAVDRAYGKW